MVLRRRNTVVRGKCALPSALLVVIRVVMQHCNVFHETRQNTYNTHTHTHTHIRTQSDADSRPMYRVYGQKGDKLKWRQVKAATPKRRRTNTVVVCRRFDDTYSNCTVAADRHRHDRSHDMMTQTSDE